MEKTRKSSHKKIPKTSKNFSIQFQTLTKQFQRYIWKQEQLQHQQLHQYMSL